MLRESIKIQRLKKKEEIKRVRSVTGENIEVSFVRAFAVFSTLNCSQTWMLKSCMMKLIKSLSLRVKKHCEWEFKLLVKL